jgi:hypothetical protein
VIERGGGLNVRRGLFRLWVVFAVLWVAGATIANWSIIDGSYHPTKRLPDFVSSTGIRIWDDRVSRWDRDDLADQSEWPRFQVKVPNGVTYSASAPDAETMGLAIDEMMQVSGEWTIPPPEPKPGDNPFIGLPSRDAPAGTIVFDEAAYWSEAQSGAVTAIVPPLAILALGAAFVWALSGFSRRASS